MTGPAFDRRVAAFLFVVSGALAYASAAGITCSNDGSTYALTRALAEQHTARIDRFVEFTEGIDVSIRDGHYYSDRAPGTAFLGAPLDWIGAHLGRRPSFPHSKHDDGAPQIPWVLLLPALATGAVTAASYRLARLTDAAPVPAVLSAAAVAAGSLVWRDGALLYRHVPAAAALSWAAVIALSIDRTEPRRRGDATCGAGVGFLIGTAALCDQPALLALLPAAAFGVIWVWRSTRRRSRIAALFCGGMLGLALPVAVQLAYDRSCFGSALATGYEYSATAHFYGSAASAFSTPLWHGVSVLLFGKAPFGSMAALSPALLAGLAGFALVGARRGWAECILLFGTFVAVLALVAKHATFDGGGDQDYRYLLCAVPLTAPGLAALADAAWRQQLVLRIAGIAAAVWLVGMSVARSAEHVRLQYGHRALPGRPILTNARNLPLWIGASALVVGAGFVTRALGTRRGRSEPAAARAAG